MTNKTLNTQQPRYNITRYNAILDTTVIFLGSQIIVTLMICLRKLGLVTFQSYKFWRTIRHDVRLVPSNCAVRVTMIVTSDCFSSALLLFGVEGLRQP